jgi:hypothetical protein
MRHRQCRGFALGVLFAALHSTIGVRPARAQSAPPTPTVPTTARDSVAARLGELRRIHTPDGIERLEPVTIDGTTRPLATGR